MDTFSDAVRRIGIVPVVVLDDAENAEPLGRALMEGGLCCAEITFRTDAAEAAVRGMSRMFPDMLTGAGTILSAEMAERAIDAGASFVVTPGLNPDVVDVCQKRGIPVVPGVMTPTEIGEALKLGLSLVKFFPAEPAGGLSLIKAVAAPYRQVSFMPTGGINAENVRAYLQYDRVAACGGSWMVKKALIEEGRFDEILAMTKEAAGIVKEIRGQR